MELLIIPLVLGIGAFLLQRFERDVEREVASDRQREAALQAYLDRMTELLLREKLLESENEKALDVARVRTLTALRGLDAARNGIALRFLFDIGLAGKLDSKLFVNANLEGADLESVGLPETNLERANLGRANLRGANLRGANLRGANLEGVSLEGAKLKDANLELGNLQDANLRGANLLDANLERANLKDANLERANLKGANLKDAFLRGANLERTNLEHANLENARFSDEQLAIAETLKGAIMPDGTIHD